MAHYNYWGTPDEIRREIRETRAELRIIKAKFEKYPSKYREELRDTREHLVFLQDLLNDFS